MTLVARPLHQRDESGLLIRYENGWRDWRAERRKPPLPPAPLAPAGSSFCGMCWGAGRIWELALNGEGAVPHRCGACRGTGLVTQGVPR